MQGQGYQVEVRAIATHRLESELGVDRRFTGDLLERGSGRHVPGDFHDFAYKALPANLDKVHEQTGVRVRIYNREGMELYDSRTTPHLKPGVALEQAREARMQDPKVTRGTARGLADQQDFHRQLPDTLERNRKINQDAANNLPTERRAQGVVPRIERAVEEATTIDRTVRIEPGAARVALGLQAVGTAALAHDAYTTGRETARLLDQNNLTGARSQVQHFAGRNLGMAGGAMAVGAMAAAAGIETGPGALAAGLAGGVIGAVAGDRLMNAVDEARIYNQRGSDGNSWRLDPEHPQQGWNRLPRPGEFGPQGPTDGDGYNNRLLHAAPRLADELNYKASNVAVELALPHTPALKDPFRQTPDTTGEAVRPGVIGASQPWTRDPQSHTWTRQAVEPATPMTHGMPTLRTVTASPQQALQLDRAAQATIADNVAQSPQAIAQRYLSAYDQSGWKQHGPVPAAVQTAAQNPLRDAHVAAPLAPPARIDQPSHPGYDLFQQARKHMCAIDSKLGRSPDQFTDNTAACLAVEACRKGLQRIDHVGIGTEGRNFWMAQGALGTFHMKTAGIPIDAAQVPLQQTSQEWAQAQQFAQQQQTEKQQVLQQWSQQHQQGNEQALRQ